MKQITGKIVKLEGKKHQASIGDVREILGLVSDQVVGPYGPEVIATLIANGLRREKRKK